MTVRIMELQYPSFIYKLLNEILLLLQVESPIGRIQLFLGKGDNGQDYPQNLINFKFSLQRGYFRNLKGFLYLTNQEGHISGHPKKERGDSQF